MALGPAGVDQPVLVGQHEAKPEAQVGIDDAVEALPGALGIDDRDGNHALHEPQVPQRVEHLADP